MNLTSIGNTHGNLPTWKRIKSHYVATAAAIALAASAAFTFAPSESHKTAVPSTPRASVSAITQQQEPGYQYFYVVETDTERGALLSEGAQNVLVAGSREAQVFMSEANRELMAHGVPFTVVDMTVSRPAAAVSPQANIQPQQASEADIIAGVLSTEYATWGAPQAASQPRYATDADIMAGVISTEYATWGAPVAAPQPRYASDADIMAGVISTERATWGFTQ